MFYWKNDGVSVAHLNYRYGMILSHYDRVFLCSFQLPSKFVVDANSRHTSATHFSILSCMPGSFLLPACFVRNGWSRERAFRVWERVKLCSSQSVNGKKKISRRKVIFSLQFAGAVSPDFFATLFCVKKESARKNKRISPVFSHTCCSDIRVLSFAGQRKREFLRCREYFGPEMRTVRNVVC